jgi:uncharacterized membrane protein
MFGKVLQTLKSALIAGMLVLAPLGITLWVLTSLVTFADRLVALLPKPLQPESWLGFPIPGIGVLIALAVVMAVGLGMRYYAGRQVVAAYEALIGRLPVLNGIYQGVNKMLEAVASDRGRHFQEVVLVEYPRMGLYCLAFVTNDEPFMDVEDGPEADQLISLFLPTTPNPTSGFYLLVPRTEVRRVDMQIEEAFKLIMSFGIVTPDGRRVANHSVAPPAALSGSRAG